MAAAPSPSKPPLYKRKWFIVLAVLLMLGLIGSCSDKKDKPETPIEESSQIEQSEEPSKSEPEVLVISLTPTTEFLEYSKKSTDALRLVECSNSEAKITTDDKLDLSHVGRQKVTYKLSISDQEVEQSIEFVIRDTKAPKIKLKEEKVTINQGESYNPKKAIAYVTDEIDGDLNLVEEEPDSKGKNAGQEQFFDKGWYTIDGVIDSSTPATYSIMIKAADKHGNVESKELLVTVKEIVQPKEETPTPEAAPVQESAAVVEAAAQAPAEPAPAEPTSAPTPEPEPTPAPVPVAEPVPEFHSYVLNNNTMKFHVPSCRDISKMNPDNRQDIETTRDDLIAQGYSPCGHCHP